MRSQEDLVHDAIAPDILVWKLESVVYGYSMGGILWRDDLKRNILVFTESTLYTVDIISCYFLVRPFRAIAIYSYCLIIACMIIDESTGDLFTI